MARIIFWLTSLLTKQDFEQFVIGDQINKTKTVFNRSKVGDRPTAPSSTKFLETRLQFHYPFITFLSTFLLSLSQQFQLSWLNKHYKHWLAIRHRSIWKNINIQAIVMQCIIIPWCPNGMHLSILDAAICPVILIIQGRNS